MQRLIASQHRPHRDDRGRRQADDLDDVAAETMRAPPDREQRLARLCVVGRVAFVEAAGHEPRADGEAAEHAETARRRPPATARAATSAERSRATAALAARTRTPTAASAASENRPRLVSRPRREKQRPSEPGRHASSTSVSHSYSQSTDSSVAASSSGSVIGVDVQVEQIRIEDEERGRRHAPSREPVINSTSRDVAHAATPKQAIDSSDPNAPVR